MTTKRETKKEAETYTVSASFFDVKKQKRFVKGEAYPTEGVTAARLAILQEANVIKRE